MAEYVTLMGAEQVGTAARTMSSAASEMVRAASNIDGALERHQRFMDEWLNRLEQILADNSSGAL